MKLSSHLPFGLSRIVGLALLPCSAGSANAELRPASLFQNHMVLQRDMPVPVWGDADPGAKVTVEFAGQKKIATADGDGKWMLKLDALTGTYDAKDLTISSEHQAKAEHVKLTDVVVGEVWICSGQSNMQFAAKAVPEVKALIPKAKHIRSFAVKRTVAFTEQDRCEGKWIARYPDSAVAFSFAHSLQASADVPIGIILSCWGSSSLEAWMPRDMVDTVPHFKTMMDEFDANTETKSKIKEVLNRPKGWSKQEDVFLRRQSNILYNAMMHPLAPYACRGLVWYQGERNTQSMFGMLKEPWFSRNSGMLIYGDVLKKWIQRYRKEWGNEDMHFLITMLPGYGKVADTSPDKASDSPTAHSWAWMRESQMQALDLKGVSVANTVDLGDIKNVHPKDKLPVGQRLALLAARDTLGKDVSAQGPVVKKVEAMGNIVIVHFDHAEGLKTIDGKAPNAFWITDDSKKWVRAQAAIKGSTVVLQSSEISKPLYVRYAFAGMPKVNLVNAEELPAYPFRSDEFKP
ncbi:sialic-acid O-acetylesterase [Oceaniferula spumae]|uniref:Sialic-acid O-acetylesterase n=1 Tax=Oceaniferula spumae TaxID=2979115 RepID=A0AAT9FIV1_9BACT